MNRFFVDKSAINKNGVEITDDDDVKHIRKVLRLGIGDMLEISDSDQFIYTVRIDFADKYTVQAKILDKQKFTSEPDLKVTLFQAIPKHGKMETIIQKCVELGIYQIIPVFTERVVVNEKAGIDSKLERWRKISAEAVKQCKRGLIPHISKSLKFDEMINRLKDYELVIFPYENEEKRTIKDLLRGIDKPQSLAVIIGPEGGFSKEEAESVINLGGNSVSLGKTILRTETAGPTALAMIMYELEL